MKLILNTRFKLDALDADCGSTHMLRMREETLFRSTFSAPILTLQQGAEEPLVCLGLFSSAPLVQMGKRDAKGQRGLRCLKSGSSAVSIHCLGVSFLGGTVPPKMVVVLLVCL